MWSTPVFLSVESQEEYEKEKDMAPEDELPRSEGVQYATGEEWREIANSFRKNKVAGWKWKWHSIVSVSGGKSKAWCYKGQYYIETWMEYY